mgnify:CR=1 FL=1
MNEKAWSDFEKTGSIMDYLNYRLSAPDVPVGTVRIEMPRINGASAYKKRHIAAGRLNDADKNKGNSSSGTGL